MDDELIPFGVKRTLRRKPGRPLHSLPLYANDPADSGAAPQRIANVFRSYLTVQDCLSGNIEQTVHLPFDAVSAVLWRAPRETPRITSSPIKSVSTHEVKKRRLDHSSIQDCLIILSTESRIYRYLYDAGQARLTHNVKLMPRISVQRHTGIPKTHPKMEMHPNRRELAIALFPGCITVVGTQKNRSHTFDLSPTVRHLTLPNSIDDLTEFCWLGSSSDRSPLHMVMMYETKGNQMAKVFELASEGRSLATPAWFNRPLPLDDQCISLSRHPNTDYGFVALSRTKVTLFDASEAYQRFKEKTAQEYDLRKFVFRMDLSLPNTLSVDSATTWNSQFDRVCTDWLCVAQAAHSLHLIRVSQKEMSGGRITATNIIESSIDEDDESPVPIPCGTLCGNLCYLGTDPRSQQSTLFTNLCENETIVTSLEQSDHKGEAIVDVIDWGEHIITSAIARGHGGCLELLSRMNQYLESPEKATPEVFLAKVAEAVRTATSCGDGENSHPSLLRSYSLGQHRYLCYIGMAGKGDNDYDSGGGVVCEFSFTKRSFNPLSHCIPLHAGTVPVRVECEPTTGHVWLLFKNKTLTVMSPDLMTVKLKLEGVMAFDLNGTTASVMSDDQVVYEVHLESLTLTEERVHMVYDQKYPLIMGCFCSYKTPDGAIRCLIGDTSGAMLLLGDCDKTGRTTRSMLVLSTIRVCSPRDKFDCIINGTRLNRGEELSVLFLAWTVNKGSLYEIMVENDEIIASLLDNMGPGIQYEAGIGLWNKTKLYDTNHDDHRLPRTHLWDAVHDPRCIIGHRGTLHVLSDYQWHPLQPNYLSVTTFDHKSYYEFRSRTPEKMKKVVIGNKEYILLLLSHADHASSYLQLMTVNADDHEFKVISKMTLPPNDLPVNMELVQHKEMTHPIIFVATQGDGAGRVHAIQLWGAEENKASFHLLSSWLCRVPLEAIKALKVNYEEEVLYFHLLCGGRNTLTLLRVEIDMHDKTAWEVAFILLQKFLCHLEVMAIDSVSNDGCFVGDALRSVGAFTIHEPGVMVDSSAPLVKALVNGDDINLEEHHTRIGSAFLVGDAQMEEICRDGQPFQTLSMAALSPHVVACSDLHGHLLLQMAPVRNNTTHQLLLPDGANTDVFATLITTGGIRGTAAFTSLGRSTDTKMKHSTFSDTRLLWGDENGNIGDVRFFKDPHAHDLQLLSSLCMASEFIINGQEDEEAWVDQNLSPSLSDVTLRACPKYTLIDIDFLQRLLMAPESLKDSIRCKAIEILKNMEGHSPDRELGSLRSMEHYLTRIAEGMH